MENQENVVNFDELKKEAKKKALKRKLTETVEAAKVKANALVEWGLEHPGELLGIVTGAGVIAKSVVKHQTSKAEDRRRETEYFEHRTGKWVKTKRKLSTREQLEAETRHQNGETWTQIFSDMRILK